MKKIKIIKKYLLENFEELESTVRALNSYDGCLEHLEIYENDDEFFEMFFDTPLELARAVCYGNYQYLDNYVRFDGYGNLETLDEWKYQNELKSRIDEIVNELIEKWYELPISDELKAMFEE